jgi:hypothetical protein
MVRTLTIIAQHVNVVREIYRNTNTLPFHGGEGQPVEQKTCAEGLLLRNLLGHVACEPFVE